MSAIEQLAARIAQRGFESTLRECAILHVADTIGACVAGSRTPQGAALLKFGAADALLSDDPAQQLMRTCAMARLSEIDDIHLGSCTTPGALVIPAALTLAAVLGNGGSAGNDGNAKNDGDAVAGAIAAGYEAMVRLCEAIDGPGILYRGIWPSYIAAPFGVAAAGAHLLGLDAPRTAHALALALALAAPGVGRQAGAAMSRWLAIGHAARSGFVAARAAAQGYTADLKMLEGEFFPSVYGVTPRIASLTEKLGERDAIADVSFKPWCAARQTISAAQGLKEILDGGVAAAGITAVEARIPPPTLKMVNHGVAAGERSSHLTSLPYQLACIALARDSMLDVAQEPASIPSEMGAFMSKVTVVADEGMQQYFPRAWPARVTVHSAAGSEERLIVHAPGDPQRPFGESEVREKFCGVVSPLLGAEPTERLWRASLAVFDAGPAALLAEVEAACRPAAAFV